MNYAEKVQQHKAEVERIRNDASKTAERYDEIIALRMLLLDFVEIVTDGDEIDNEAIDKFKDKLLARAKTWGKKGDCV